MQTRLSCACNRTLWPNPKDFGKPVPGCLTGKSEVSVLATLMFQTGGLGSMSGLSSLALPVVFIAAMYFLMIAPNQKKQKAWQEMLAAIKTGDRVTTSGGLRGVVLQVKDDVVVLRVQPDNIKLEFVKSAIASVSTEETKS